MSDTYVTHARPPLRIYLAVGIGLFVLTAVTVTASVFDLDVFMAVTVGLLIALVKGSLVALFFMHLSNERKLIYGALMLTVVFFLVLLLLPVGSMMNSYGVDPVYVP